MYTRITFPHISKQPKHLILSFFEPEESMNKFLQNLADITSLVPSTKTCILTLYDASGRLEQEFSNFVEILNIEYNTRKPNRKLYIISGSNSADKVYCIDNNDKAKETKQLTLSTLSKITVESDEQPLVVNILGPLDNFRNFLQSINNKENKIEKLRPDLSCNKSLKVFENMGVKIGTVDYDTSLLVNFCDNLDSCLGIPFDLLSNAEVVFEKKFKYFGAGALAQAYEKFSHTKQRRGK